MNNHPNQNGNSPEEPEVVIPEVIDIKDVKKHKVVEDLPHGHIYGAPGNGMSVAAIILSALSIFVTVLGLLFSWLFYVGFIMNCMSFAAALVSLLLSVIAKVRRSRSGMPNSLIPVIALTSAIIALIFSSMLFSCTGRVACLYCTAQTSITHAIR